jgi:hypothetical protein
MDNSHYGLWTVLGPGTKKDHLLCRCECGTEREVNRHSLERGLSRSCGCVAHAEGARKRRALPPDPDERREIARRFVEDGETQGALAEAFGCGIGTIIRVLRLEGVPAGAHGQKGERHHAWKGGKRLNENGYVMIRVDQNDEIGQAMGPQNGYLLESRLVMAHHLGRPLFPDEFVHHGPKGKQDNTIENLELWTTHHPKGQRVDELLEFAREIVTRYKDIEDKL